MARIYTFGSICLRRTVHHLSISARHSWGCILGKQGDHMLSRSLWQGTKQHSSLPHGDVELKVQDDLFLQLTVNRQEMGGTLSLLLLLAAHRNDTESVHHILKKAEVETVKPSGTTMEQVLVAYIKNRNVDAATNLYKSLQRKYPNVALDCCTVLGLGTMLVEHGKYPEAVKTLREFAQLGNRKEVHECSDGAARNLLDRAVETGDYELTKLLFDTLLSAELIHPGATMVVPLIQCKLDCDDLQGAVEVAEMVYQKYETLPKRMEILLRIMKQQPTREGNTLPVFRKGGHATQDGLLERMFCLVAECYGPIQAQHDLMFAYLESGRPSEARQVLQHLDRDVNENKVRTMCKVYYKNEQEATLEHLLSASRGSNHIDRHKICEVLLDTYKIDRESAGEKGLALWSMMQEEGLTPSPAFLTSLAAVLAYYNMKIPFPV